MSDALSSEAMSRLIGAIYDSALDPGRWPDALTGLREAMRYASASLSLVALPHGETLLDISASAKPDWIETMRRNRRDAIDIWGGAEAMMGIPLSEPVVLSRLRDRCLWDQNDLYRNWGRAEGIHDFVAIALVRDQAMIGSLAFVRHLSAGDVGDAEVEMARVLAPHVQRAVAISRLLDLQSVISSTFDAALDTLAVAVTLVDADLRIVHANAAARTLIAAGNVMAARHGALSIRPPQVEAALRVAVREAAENEAGMGRRGFGIRASGPGGAGAVIHVLPLRHGPLRPGLVPGAVAALFIASASEAARVPADALSALYDLTPAEVRVFAEIAAGRTRAETARALGLSPATVKAHLSQIFLKTGTKRQADLVALNAAIALPLRD